MAEEVPAQHQFAQSRYDLYREFIQQYTEGSEQPHYIQLITDAVNTKQYCVPINLQHVYSKSPNLYYDTIKYVDEMIPVIGNCVCQIASELFPGNDEEIDANMRV